MNVYGDVLGSHLHHNFWGVYSFGLEGGRWLTNEVDHNAGYGFDPHDDSDHLLIEGNNVHHNGGLGRGCTFRRGWEDGSWDDSQRLEPQCVR